MKKICKRVLMMGLVPLMIMTSTMNSYAEEYEYDDLNRITKVIYEDGSYVEYEYDSNGNILSINVCEANSDKESGTSNSGGDESKDSENQGGGNAGGENQGSESGESQGDVSGNGESQGGESGENQGGDDKGDESQSSESEDGKNEDVKSLLERIISVMMGFWNRIIQWLKALLSWNF